MAERAVRKPRRAGTAPSPSRADGASPIPPSPPPPGSSPPDAAWDDWDRPLTEPPVPVLHLDGFDGPMELLLDLAQRRRIDLARMSPLDLVEQFSEAVQRLQPLVSLERRADWHVAASRLVELRSRLLLPVSPEDAAAAKRELDAQMEALRGRALAEGAADWLEARPTEGRDVFVQPRRPDPRAASFMELMEGCLFALRLSAPLPADAPVFRYKRTDIWTAAQALQRMTALLQAHPEGGELAAFLPALQADDALLTLKARAAVASTLMAGLELARHGAADMSQAAEWCVVTLRKPQER